MIRLRGSGDRLGRLGALLGRDWGVATGGVCGSGG